MSEIKNLKPECIWRNFYALTQVPRPSGHLEKIQQFLLDFAAKAGVEAFKDAAGNIVMRKPATWHGEPQGHYLAGTHGHGAAEEQRQHTQLRYRPH